MLPDFVKRMLGFADKAEAHFTAAALLETANAKIVALDAEIVTLKAAASDHAAQIVTLTDEVATAKAAVVAKDAELVTVRAELVTAKGTANAVIESQGLKPDKLPPLAPRADGAKDAKTLDLDEQCEAAYAKRNGN